MSPDRIVLLIIDRSGEGGVRGRTLLQKRAYFLDQALNLNLGFKAHYYGPYSPTVEDCIGRLKAVGFIHEEKVDLALLAPSDFEPRRYDYKLTSGGKTLVQDAEQNSKQDVSKIRKHLEKLTKAGDNGDIEALSIAAKTHFILQSENDPSEIGKVARSLGWKIGEESIQKAVAFLQAMNSIN